MTFAKEIAREVANPAPNYSDQFRRNGKAGDAAYKQALLEAGLLPEMKKPGTLRDALIGLVNAKKLLEKENTLFEEKMMLELSRLRCIRHEINLEIVDVIAPTDSPKRIIKETASRHGLSVEIITSNERAGNVVRARQELFYLLRQRTSLSFPEIARLFEGAIANQPLDHTTVIHGAERHKTRVIRRKSKTRTRLKRAKA